MMERYNPVSITLHWLIALLIFSTFPLGLYMADLPLSPQKLQYFSWHKWAGVTIFLLVLIRILWRIGHKPPAPVPMPRWQRQASAAVHYLLYVFMFIIPLSGWLLSSAKGMQTVWFGVLPLPDLVAKNKELGDTLEDIHETLNYGMLLLFGIHLAAALKHQFIDKDHLLSRMNPFART
ncbi:MAG: cytochrome b [Georgfuchsia sp.]